MNQKHCLLVMALAGVLSLAPLPAFSGNLSNFSDALEQLADMTRAADRAHDALNDAMQGGRDYSRYDRDWRNAESRLERARIRTMAHIAGVSESRIRSLRDDGYSWERIARKYKVDPRRFGYGQSRYGISGRACPPDLPRREGFRPDRRKSSKNTTTRNIEIEKRPFR